MASTKNPFKALFLPSATSQRQNNGKASKKLRRDFSLDRVEK